MKPATLRRMVATISLVMAAGEVHAHEIPIREEWTRKRTLSALCRMGGIERYQGHVYPTDESLAVLDDLRDQLAEAETRNVRRRAQAERIEARRFKPAPTPAQRLRSQAYGVVGYTPQQRRALLTQAAQLEER